MKLPFLAVILLFYYSATATKYHFSSVTGNDSYTSAQAQSPSTPWKTLHKLNSFATSLKPGDSILFKKGETFFGVFRIDRSGSSLQPIVISSYGSGSNPVITSLVNLTNWSSEGNGIWTSYNTTLGASVNVVLMNGVLKEMGRFPNNNAQNRGWLTIDGLNSNTSFTDKELSATPNWTGAEVVIRKNRWVIDRNQISSHQGSTIQYISSSNYVAQKGFGYFIQNHIKTLDLPGEWYYQPSSKKLSIYLGHDAPYSYKIEAATAEHTIHLSGSNYVIFKNLTITGGNTNSIKISGGRNIEIFNCEISFSGRNGISASKHINLKVENSSILYSNSLGIDISSSNTDPLIRNNKVENTGLYPGMGETTGPNGTGIQCYSKGAVIEYNKVRNNGFNGIAIKLNSVTVRNNHITDFCSIKDDGGGIYSHNGSNTASLGAKITGNLIFNGKGAPQGTTSSEYSAEGIYMDDNSNNALIENNTVANCSRGIFLHNARNIVVNKNTFYNNRIQFYARHDSKGDPLRNLTITNNIFFSKQSTQLLSHIETILNDISNMGHFDHNYYARPIDDAITIFTSFTNSTGTAFRRWYDLDSWKTQYGKDLNSQKAPISITPYFLKGITSSNKIINGNFSNKEWDIFGNGCTLSVINSENLDDNCLQVTPTTPGAAISMGVGSLTANNKYLLKYSVYGEANASLAANLRYGGSPFKPITPIVYRKVSPKRYEYDILFTPSVNQNLGALIFTTDGSSKYWLDNIQLYEATVTTIDPGDFIRFEYNSTANDKLIILNETYRSVNNTAYSGSIVIPPFSSIVLIKNNAQVNNILPSLLVDPSNVFQNKKFFTMPAPIVY